MIRPLGLIDALRILVLRGPDWAVTSVGAAAGGLSAFSSAAFLWDRVRLRRKGGAWVSVKGVKVGGLVSARPCSGPTAWMVDHLVTPHRDDEPCYALLERAAVHAGRRGAQRLFLCLPHEWHLLETVRRSGFLSCTQVFRLTLPGRRPLLGVEPIQGFRPRVSSDDHPLFRLYNATTPAEARFGIGMTLQQWKDAQEPRGKGTRELVLEEWDGVKGWIRLDRYRRWTRVRLTIHPDWKADPRAIVAFVLAEEKSRTLWWEVPEHQGVLRLLLERVGFEVGGSYRLMVNSLVARVTEPSLASVPTSA